MGIVLVFRDITMERKTQDALIANEKLAVAGRLAATIAHEIHNPLDSVSNLLYLMRNGASKEESSQFMDMAEQELARVTQISRAMLGLYRESKAPVVVDLKEMLQEILLLLERRLADLGVTVATEMPKSVSVAAFPAELRQVFTNLITNAAEAAGEGGKVRVSITPQTAGVDADGQKMQAGAVVTIADNGPGISEEIRTHLFQPFFTTKGEQGTGLGLWVSRGIVNKHGGTISLDKRHQRSRARHRSQRISRDESNDHRQRRLRLNILLAPLEQAQLLGDDRGGLLTRRTIDIVVRDEANRVRTDSADQHTLLLQRGSKCRRITATSLLFPAQFEDDDVRLHGFEIDLCGFWVAQRQHRPADARSRDLRRGASASHAARSGQQPQEHPPAACLHRAPCDGCAPARSLSCCRQASSQPERQAPWTDRTSPCRNPLVSFATLMPERSRSVEDASAIEMHGQPGLPRASPDLFQHRKRRYRAAGHIVRVFEADQSSLRTVVDLRADRRLDVVPRQNASLRRNRPRQAAGERRHHRHLPVEHMRPRLADDLLPMLGMQTNRNLVSHRAGGDEDRSLASKDLRSLLLQTVNRGVFTVDIVANLGGGHRLAHGWGWTGDGVAAQIDHDVRSLLISCVFIFYAAEAINKRLKTSFEASRPCAVSRTQSELSSKQTRIANLNQRRRCAAQHGIAKLPAQTIEIDALVQSQPEKQRLFEGLHRAR